MFILALTSSCAFFFPNSKKPHQQPFPKAPTQVSPGGNGDNWRYIGTTNDGMLVIELNNNSIQNTKHNPELFNFEDRKMVVEPTQYTYPNGQPHFKYVINAWQIDCKNKKYLLLNAKTYNPAAKLLGSYNYANDNNVKWISFGEGSIAELEYKFICLNQKRNLGY